MCELELDPGTSVSAPSPEKRTDEVFFLTCFVLLDACDIQKLSLTFVVKRLKYL